MKRLLVLMFLLSAMCPFAFAELTESEIVIDKELKDTITNAVEEHQPTILDKLIISTPRTVNKEFGVTLMGDSLFPCDPDVAEEFEDEVVPVTPENDGSETHKTDSYNLVSILLPVNKSILEQIDWDRSSREPVIFFKEKYDNYIRLQDANEDDYFFSFDYEFSFFYPEDEKYWKTEELEIRELEGKILRLIIRYSPKYFTFGQYSEYNAPFLTYTDKHGGEFPLFLVPNIDNLKKDFTTLKDKQFLPTARSN